MSTEWLLRNYRGGHTECWEGFKKYALEMGSDVMIYTPSFREIGSDIKKLIGER
jgi:hypothetical protein